MQTLVYAIKDEKIVSAVLERAENKESLVIGFVACHGNYRKQGITKKLLGYFEDLARKQGFKYITLDSEEDAFYTLINPDKISSRKLIFIFLYVCKI